MGFFETIRRSADISPDGRYRYILTRIWDPQKAPVVFIMCNPSTADAEVDDPTIKKCMAYGRQWGKGGIYVLNLFAYRSTDPLKLRKVSNPIGPDNDKYIRRIVEQKPVMIVAAWGVNGQYLDRGLAVRRMVGQPLQILRLSKDGHPVHPLYLPLDLMPKLWT